MGRHSSLPEEKGTVMSGWFGREPAQWLGLISATIALISSTAFEMTIQQQGVLNAVAVAIVGFVTAMAVSGEKAAPLVGTAKEKDRLVGDFPKNLCFAPDGKSIAYFSDESGEYALHVRDQSGTGETRKINLGTPPSFYYSPTWSPDLAGWSLVVAVIGGGLFVLLFAVQRWFKQNVA